MIEKIKQLSIARVKFLIESKNEWYEWSKTYWKAIKWEIKEAKDENKKNNSVYLEDELWDIFWDYMCLLASLEREGKITSVDKVFERAYSKFSWRIQDDWSYRWDWKTIKDEQKKKRKEEHEKLYPKKSK